MLRFGAITPGTPASVTGSDRKEREMYIGIGALILIIILVILLV